MRNIKIIAFDADDTLWDNEPYFREAEALFCDLISPYYPKNEIYSELLKTEIKNISIYGFGAKSITLSMIEAAIKLSQGKVTSDVIGKIIENGKTLLNMPIKLLPGVEDVLKELSSKYKLVVATKGDLLNQEQKLKKSGLAGYFHHVEVMSDKRTSDYIKLIRNLHYKPQELIMAGNSIKSDILPVLEAGAWAAYVPYHVMWAYEEEGSLPDSPRLIELKNITDLLKHLK
ncbi:Hydrolase family protein [Elusimicrobium minutum Pei191]|uniref:Hydrolase family protein n=1 Tax=Elusimicrobium minutum (strain Pei191) TaxID=445932 RepID=B2KCV4_ELUMP|nr:HAD family hydrolase [Elusimicrobium minutum]ACC98350.1 Hydrolase family protein [Elusimicrobium minutum Pei191]